MASEPINLNHARKARAKVKKRVQANENAAKFGRSKAQKAADKATSDKTRRDLDQHRREE